MNFQIITPDAVRYLEKENPYLSISVDNGTFFFNRYAIKLLNLKGNDIVSFVFDKDNSSYFIAKSSKNKLKGFTLKYINRNREKCVGFYCLDLVKQVFKNLGGPAKGTIRLNFDVHNTTDHYGLTFYKLIKK